MPFLARWPGKVPAGTTCDEVVCLTDLLATVAAIVGEKLPEDAGEDSYDIGPALRGEKLGQPIREATVLHNAEGVFAIRQGPWKLIAAGAAEGAPKASPWVKEGREPALPPRGRPEGDHQRLGQAPGCGRAADQVAETVPGPGVQPADALTLPME